MPAVTDRKAKTMPYIFKCFEASTGHITKNDADLLKKDDCPVVVYDYEYGYFVYVGGDRLCNTDKENILKYGFSKEFYNLLKLAAKNDCKHLALDCDGFVYADLPTFDW
jgi:hypothetical protein